MSLTLRLAFLNKVQRYDIVTTMVIAISLLSALLWTVLGNQPAAKAFSMSAAVGLVIIACMQLPFFVDSSRKLLIIRSVMSLLLFLYAIQMWYPSPATIPALPANVA
jgi:multisubunit Na+/H+ antiporter MnhE subunit